MELKLVIEPFADGCSADGCSPDRIKTATRASTTHVNGIPSGWVGDLCDEQPEV